MMVLISKVYVVVVNGHCTSCRLEILITHNDTGDSLYRIMMFVVHIKL